MRSIRQMARRVTWLWLFVASLGATSSLAVAGDGSRTAALDPRTGRPDDFFGLTNVYTFHLTIAPDAWARMEQVDDPGGGRMRPPGAGPGPGGLRPGLPRGGNGLGMAIEYKEAAASLEFQDQPFGQVSVRFKGHSSFRFARNSLKRSLKIDFNDLKKGQTFFGLTKLNLNNNAMDPSQMREALAYHIFKSAAVPAGRTAFAWVYISVPGKHSRTFAGLYTVVEQVDERFLKERFGAKNGLLLKPERLMGLPYLGDDWAAYEDRVKPKEPVSKKDAARFIKFVKTADAADDAQFSAAIAEYMDVDEFLRFVAVQSLLSNMDSPLMTGHNYFLYLHPGTQKFVYIPWDLNEAFGGFGPAGSPSEQMDLSVEQPFARGNRLVERVLQSPDLQARYQRALRDLLARVFNPGALFPVIDAMAAAIRPSLSGDPMVSLAQFDAAVAESKDQKERPPDSSWSSGFPFGPRGPGANRAPLKLFIDQRGASAQLQLDGKKSGVRPRELRPGFGGPPQR